VLTWKAAEIESKLPQRNNVLTSVPINTALSVTCHMRSRSVILGGSVVRTFNSGPRGPEFDSQPVRYPKKEKIKTW